MPKNSEQFSESAAYSQGGCMIGPVRAGRRRPLNNSIDSLLPLRSRQASPHDVEGRHAISRFV